MPNGLLDEYAMLRGVSVFEQRTCGDDEAALQLRGVHGAVHHLLRHAVRGGDLMRRLRLQCS